jgi:hypothetical protein
LRPSPGLKITDFTPDVSALTLLFLARFALHENFELIQFDNLCLFIEGEEYVDFERNMDTPVNRYQDLCDFILEIATELIAPDLEPAFVSRLENSAYKSAATERYRHFFNTVIKARVWLDNRELFERLKAAAMRFLVDISHVCRMRQEELAVEARGKELLSFVWYNHLCLDKLMLWWSGGCRGLGNLDGVSATDCSDF